MRRRAAGTSVLLALGLLIGAPAADAAGAPIPGPVWTTAVDVGSAGLRAELDPNGQATSYHFSYLPESTYEANLGAGRDGFSGAVKVPPAADPVLAAGSGPVQVAQVASGLAAETRYRLRVEATNVSSSVVSRSIVILSDAPANPTFMLDSRGWEMASPAEKGAGEVQRPGAVFGGGVVQAATEGAAITYSSSYSFGASAGAPPGSQYVSRRGASGWETVDATVATTGGAYGPSPDGVPFQLLAPDLSAGVMLDGLCASSVPCPRRYSLRAPGGPVLATSATQADLRLAGATPDLSQRILSTCAALTADAVAAPGSGGCDPAQPNLYRWSDSGLVLLNLLPGEAVGTPGAALAAPAGAVSEDGGRIYFSHAGDLFLREGTTTEEVDAVAGGGGTFEAASTNGAVAYFSSSGHLYRYDAAGAGGSADLTPGGGLQGVLGASADGEWVYYLTSDGLFVRHGGASLKVADAADPVNYPPATGAARVAPNGLYLAFLSTQPLTGYDNRERDGGGPNVPGAPLRQVYLYGAGADRLTCASCNPFGEQPLGPATIPGAYANGTGPAATRSYKPRALSVHGRRLFFESGDDLALRDVDRSPPRADPDVYEWEAQGAGSCTRPGGCVALISSGRTPAGASFLDASASGNDVFFLTSDSLVGSDAGFADVYDARVGGGFPEPSKPIACVGDACQFLPSEPEDPQPGSLTPSPGNPPLGATPKSSKCRKGFVKRKGKCTRKNQVGKSKKRGGKAKQGAKRGGARR
jgi:hypothetical protein